MAYTWMGETAQALRHTDICRFGTWMELERLSKNIPAMRWLVCKLVGYNANTSPADPALAFSPYLSLLVIALTTVC